MDHRFRAETFSRFFGNSFESKQVACFSLITVTETFVNL